jgi:ABC-2 type transport system permease protein
MKNFTNLLKKEIKELLTRQTLIVLIFIVILYGMMGNFISGAKEDTEKPTNLAILDLDRSEYSENILNKLSEQSNIKAEILEETDIEKAIDKAREKEISALLVIPDDFEKNTLAMEKTELEAYSIIKGLGIKETTSNTALLTLVNSIDKEISVNFLQKTFPDKDPETILNPLNIKEFVVVKDKMVPGNPAIIQGLTTTYSMMIPIILMILIIYAGTMIMTSMGMEKENKTLETLLTLPIKRIWIVLAKMLGAAIVALIMAVVIMAGLGYLIFSITPNIPDSGAILETLGLSMYPLDYILLGISLFLAILIALALCLILGMLSQDVKSAQTMNFLIILLVMIPYLLLMFQDIETISMPVKILLYAIPFSHPFIASKALIFHNYPIVIGGIVYMAVFAVAMLYLAVWLFNTDKVLTAKLSLKRAKRK